MAPDRPKIVGIVNITEDSFSDGGHFLDREDAIAHAQYLVEEGADMVELGPASSHPDSQPVTAAEEIARLAPVVEHLACHAIPIAVDTYQAETQIWCAHNGVEMINDIQGFADTRSHPVLAEVECKLVVMHSVQQRGRATRVETAAANIRSQVDTFFASRIAELTGAGIRRDRLIIDPGMGFFLGSNPEPSLTMLAGIGELRRSIGLPVFVSVSRKSFLGSVTGRDIHERAVATVVAELFAATRGADYIRTHNPAALTDALVVWDALTSATAQQYH